MKKKYALALHGGAGTIIKGNMSPELEEQYKNGLRQALLTGQKILSAEGSALVAVEETVKSLEDNPLFNAGRGSVFNSQGQHEMEASIMCGKTLQAGAVAGLSGIRNPIALCRKILKEESYVFLSGKGALDFALEQGFEITPEEYFFSKERHEQWCAIQNSTEMKLDHSGDHKFGTVGAVAYDLEGNLAAATSTGGLTNKQYGRLGDSAIIGSGTYANNATCAISCTGYGEYFLRGVVAYDISCLMEYKGLTLEDAAKRVIMDKMTELKGEGGIVGVDGKGNINMTFNSEGMYRASIEQNGEPTIKIYR